MTASEKELLLTRYRECLCYFCKLSAYLEEIRRKVLKGASISEEHVAMQLERLEITKNELLDIKECLGYDTGIDFTKDIKFQGFEYKDGMLSGDYEHLLDIVNPWVTGFDKEHVYTYEVGVLILYHYMRQMGYDDDGKPTPVTFWKMGKQAIKSFKKHWKESKGKRLELWHEAHMKKYEKRKSKIT